MRDNGPGYAKVYKKMSCIVLYSSQDRRGNVEFARIFELPRLGPIPDRAINGWIGAWQTALYIRKMHSPSDKR